MDAASRCSFCQRLPAINTKRGGKPAKCPVCRSELLVTSEATYRLATAAELASAPKARAWKPAAFLILAGCLMAWVGTQLIRDSRVARPESSKGVPNREGPHALRVHAQGVPPTVAEASIVIPAEPRPLPVANQPEAIAARKPVYKPTAAAKTIPENVGRFPGAKESGSTVRTSVAKALPTLSYSKYFMKQSRMFSYQVDYRPRTLTEIPEIDLDEPLPAITNSSSFPTSSSSSFKHGERARIAGKIEDILKLTRDDPDAFVKKMKDRAHLAGLAFIMGDRCRLTAEAARDLRDSSRAVRQRLDLMRGNGPTLERLGSISEKNLPALEQILLAENVPCRKVFAKKLEGFDKRAATRILAERAIFDVDSDVRETALEALKSRPPEDFGPILLQGLRYPWPQVVNNSAEALIKLKRTDLAPALVDMLDQPDPDAPFLGGPKNNQLMVRELVRVNHHRNCLLCHAPVDAKNLDRRAAIPIGPIPTPGERMPISSGLYYSFRPGENVVRADVTYLRQDFSMMLPVALASSDRWPANQRYDFLVRVRALKWDEALTHTSRIVKKETPHKTTIMLALRALTGEDAGYSAAAWRHVNPRQERAWRSACKK